MRKIGNINVNLSGVVHKIYVKLLLEFFLQNTAKSLYIHVIVEWGQRYRPPFLLEVE